jgi:crossover junction endodeoxyribonuclease RusA
MKFEMPFPPSINHYWRHCRGRTFISGEGEAFRQHVALLLTILRTRPLRGDLVLSIDVHPPDRRKRDLDNLLKALGDALQHGGAYKDDNQIAELHVYRRPPEPRGKVIVTIGEIAA